MKPEENPEGKRLYLTVYLELNNKTDNMTFLTTIRKIFPTVSLGIEPGSIWQNIPLEVIWKGKKKNNQYMIIGNFILGKSE